MTVQPETHVIFELPPPANFAVIRDAPIHPALRETLLVALDGEIGTHMRQCDSYGLLEIEVLEDEDLLSAMWGEDLGTLCCFSVTPGRLKFERWVPGDAENRQTETLEFSALDSVRTMVILGEFDTRIGIKEIRAVE